MEELARVNDNDGKQSEKGSTMVSVQKGTIPLKEIKEQGELAKKGKQLELGACGNVFAPLHQRLHQLDGTFEGQLAANRQTRQG